MAPLKRGCTYSRVWIDCFDFHEWKFMAPLKLTSARLDKSDSTKFPWMKIHGSIEAIIIHAIITDPSKNFHEWKFMAPLKPESLRVKCYLSTFYFHEWKFMAPLKLHKGGLAHRQTDISMNENSWLHWSLRVPGWTKVIVPNFHEWKFMAPLKQSPWGISLFGDPPISMNENSWLHWS